MTPSDKPLSEKIDEVLEALKGNPEKQDPTVTEMIGEPALPYLEPGVAYYHFTDKFKLTLYRILCILAALCFLGNAGFAIIVFGMNKPPFLCLGLASFLASVLYLLTAIFTKERTKANSFFLKYVETLSASSQKKHATIGMKHSLLSPNPLGFTHSYACL